MKKTMMNAALAAMLAALTVSQGVMAQEDDGVIKIGVVAPMTGGLAVLGEGSQHSVDMAECERGVFKMGQSYSNE